jgi:CBS domain containing-hemolysin-like protein
MILTVGIPVAIILALTLLNGLFVAAEFAIVAAPKTRIQQLAAGGSATALFVLETLESAEAQNRYITTAQVGITIVSLGLGMYGEHVLADWFLEGLHFLGELAEPTAHSIATLLAIGSMTYLHVVIGEMIPKSLSLQNAERMSILLASPMSLMERIFSPLVWTLTHLGNWIVSLLGIPIASEDGKLFSSEELEYLIEESLESGLLEHSDHLFIDNIFDLEERIVEQVMTPRNRLKGIPHDSDWASTLALVCESNKTRYPVYQESIDQVIGIVHIKDIARHAANGSEKFSLSELARPVTFVPDSLHLDQLLIQFRRESLQIAIALDEFGGTAGLVTIEDLIEEVVGEIQDEFDTEEQPIIELRPGLLRVRGNVILEELEQLYDLDIDHEDSNTVGGLVMAMLGRIPVEGDVAEYQGGRYTVESLDGMAVKWLTIEFNPKE